MNFRFISNQIGLLLISTALERICGGLLWWLRRHRTMSRISRREAILRGAFLAYRRVPRPAVLKTAGLNLQKAC